MLEVIVKACMILLVTCTLVWRGVGALPVCLRQNDTAAFTCTVEDNSRSDGTVWSGTVFDCPAASSIIHNRIYLPHSDYNSRARGTCNSGAIMAESTGVNDSLYTSMLTIMPLSLAMNGSTVRCFLSTHSDQDIVHRVLRVGAFPKSPPVISLSFPKLFETFRVSWKKPTGVIGGIDGFETAIYGDCGQCSNIGVISANTVQLSCAGWMAMGQTCNISIDTITADCQFRSVVSSFAVIHLQLPVAPSVNRVIGTYDVRGTLMFVETDFAKQKKDANGFSPVYIIMFAHSSWSEPVEELLDCSLNASCTHHFNNVDQLLNGDYSIRVGTMTPIGKTLQPNNQSVTIGIVNTFVRVTVDVLEDYTIINCFFSQKYSHLTCQIQYGLDCDTLPFMKQCTLYNESHASLLLLSIVPSTSYCFILTADNQSHTVKVQGSFTGHNHVTSSTIGNTVIVMTVTILMALLSLITLTATIVICFKKGISRLKSGDTDNTAHVAYYSAVSETVAVDPTYEEVSVAVVKNNSEEIATEHNEAYHPVQVKPNEAYQINVMRVPTGI